MIFNMKLATSEQIKEIDRLATSKYKIPSLLRMELAGLKSYEIIMKEYSPKNTLIVAGTGNNGGDGLVVSRHLFLNKYRCSIIIVGNLE
jgi:NAD(P)H-hydrate epimerase